LLQVLDLVESIFGIIGINKALMELELENLIGQKLLAIDHGISNFAELFVPVGCVIDHQEASVQDSVLSSFGDHCSLTISFKMDKPVFGARVLVSAIKGFRMKTFQMVFREPGIHIRFVGTGRSSLVCIHFFF